MIAPTDLREIIRSGLLSFPVTPFDADDNVNHAAFSAHLEWLSQHPVAGLIVAGGILLLLQFEIRKSTTLIRQTVFLSGDVVLHVIAKEVRRGQRLSADC